MSNINQSSKDIDDAVSTALTSLKNSNCLQLDTTLNSTKTVISNDYLNGYDKLSVSDSVWMDSQTGNMYRAIDMVDKDGMNRYVDNSEFLIFKKWSNDSVWETAGCWLAEQVKEVVEENKWTVTGTTNGMYINNFHSLPATIRIYAILDMVIVEYGSKSYRFRYMKCDKDAFKTEFDKTIRKLIIKIIEFTDKYAKMTENFNKSLDIMMQGSEFET
jgi:hypothetical protein